MIELKEICKTYKSKKGTPTVALDHVNLKLDQTGMTFILGKSGSGKSTLLNILGGLDKYDSGDMTVLGKSTKQFKNEDYDSYRNTYIGFVFQEFNILEDYDVYENIILALQLQKKEIIKEDIESLLLKLELNDLKHRKLNELSGGQKQRVAIARALIKEPKIILADEPTGNLDSNTSRQVMELLKEISKEKLVVVISHDRESAEKYGDRIIELKDGKIESDQCPKEIEVEKKISSYQIIKSKLPWRKSFKLGIGSLKHKKIKLCFTILLTIFALLFLSVSDTLSSYNVEKAHAKLLKDKKETFVQVQKYRYYNDSWMERDNMPLTDGDVKKIMSSVSGITANVYQINDKYSQATVSDLLKITQNDDYQNQYISLGTHISAEIVEFTKFQDLVTEKVIGKTPTATNEIMISNYVADLIMENGITEYNSANEILGNDLYRPKSYEELANSDKYFYFSEKGKVKIVGIIDYDLSKYKELASTEKNNLSRRELNNLTSELSHKVNYLFNKIYVVEGFSKELPIENNGKLVFNNNYEIDFEDVRIKKDSYYLDPTILNKEIEYFDGSTWKKISKLNKNEMLLNISLLKDFREEDFNKKLATYLSQNLDGDQDELIKKFVTSYIGDTDVIGKSVSLKVYEGRTYDANKPTVTYDDIKIVGFVMYEEAKNPTNYFSDELVSKYETKAITQQAVLVKNGAENGFSNVLKQYPHDSILSVRSSYTNDVLSVVSMINVFKKIAFYASIVFFVFAIFLISNFIFTSIHYRKKEIGILRALGARSSDVVKIFLWEGVVLAFVSGTLASIFLYIITTTLNNFIMIETSIILTPFIVGLRQFIVIYFIVFVVVLFSSIIPIIKISRMKPIDAILKK